MVIPGRKTVPGLCLNQEPDKNIQASLAKGPTNGKESQIVTISMVRSQPIHFQNSKCQRKLAARDRKGQLYLSRRGGFVCFCSDRVILEPHVYQASILPLSYMHLSS